MIIRTIHKASALAIAALVSLAGTSCKRDAPMLSETYYDMFDTFVTVMAYGEESGEFEDNCRLITSQLYECSRLYDIYREYEGINNIATINKSGKSAPVEVDERIISLLEFSKDMYTRTGGTVNIAMGSVLSLWHDAREQSETAPTPPPSEEELRRAAEHTDINDIIIDRESMTVSLADPEMSIDVGAVAKGYAAQLVADMLRGRGVSGGYALNLGGNVMALGERLEGEGWSVAVRSPYTEYSSTALNATIKDASLVTSGNYERHFEYEGVSYHHIIDPDTLMPSGYFDSVSVTGASSAVCDALSTALFCMSYEEGVSLLDHFDGVEAVWIRGGETIFSPGFPLEKPSQK